MILRPNKGFYSLRGDVFFTPTSETAADIGHVSVIEEDLPNTCYSYHLMRFRPNENVFYSIFPQYSFASETVRSQLTFEAQGAQRFVINRDAFEDITVPLPSINEQEKVGELFRNLDELIEAKEQELEKLRHIKLALLDKMFPNDESDNTNRGGYNKLINSDLLIRYQLHIFQSNPNTPAIRFRGFTEPWKVQPLSALITVGKGKGYSKNSTFKTGTQIILYGMLYTDYCTNIYGSNLCSIKYDWSIVSKGNEVIVPASGETAEDIARASAILSEGIILGGDINILYPGCDINPSFLALELTYGRTHKSLVRKAQGISVVHIHNSDIEELSLCFPSITEQKKIGAFFKEQDDNIANAQLQIIKLKNIKQALMEKMFA